MAGASSVALWVLGVGPGVRGMEHVDRTGGLVSQGMRELDGS